jgi:hypothetical protein
MILEEVNSLIEGAQTLMGAPKIIKQGAQTIGDAAKATTQTVGDAAKSAGKTIGRTFNAVPRVRVPRPTAPTLGGGLQQVGTGLKNMATSRTGKNIGLVGLGVGGTLAAGAALAPGAAAAPVAAAAAPTAGAVGTGIAAKAVAPAAVKAAAPVAAKVAAPVVAKVAAAPKYSAADMEDLRSSVSKMSNATSNMVQDTALAKTAATNSREKAARHLVNTMVAKKSNLNQ